MKATFSWIKNTLFCLQFSPQNAENRISGLWNLKNFWGSTPTDLLPRKRGLTAPLRYSRLLYWNLLATSIIFFCFIETPVLDAGEVWKCERRSSLAREFSCALLCSLETESFLVGYPPETNEKKWQCLLFWDINAHPFHFLLKLLHVVTHWTSEIKETTWMCMSL